MKLTGRLLVLLFAFALTLLFASSAQAAWTSTKIADSWYGLTQLANNDGTLEAVFPYQGALWHSQDSGNGFTTPVEVVPASQLGSSSVYHSKFVIGADGTAALVYEYDSNNSDLFTDAVRVIIRSAGSNTWSQPYTVASTQPASPIYTGNGPDLQISPDGGILVEFKKINVINPASWSFDYLPTIAYKAAAASSFTDYTVTSINSESAPVLINNKTIIDSNNNITFAWVLATSTGHSKGGWLYASTLAAGSSQFSQPELLCQGCRANLMGLASTSSGTAAVSWSQYSLTNGEIENTAVKVATRPAAASSFSAPKTIASGTLTYGAGGTSGTQVGGGELAVSPDNGIGVLWSSWNGGTSSSYKLAYQGVNDENFASTTYGDRDWSNPATSGYIPFEHLALGNNGAALIVGTGSSNDGNDSYLIASKRDSANDNFSAAERVNQALAPGVPWQEAYTWNSRNVFYRNGTPVIGYYSSCNGVGGAFYLATFGGKGGGGPACVAETSGGNNYQSDQNADGQVDPQTTATDSQLHLDVLAAIELSDLSNDSDAAAPVEGGTDNSVVFQSSGGLRSNLSWGITNSATTEGGDSSLNGGASGADAALASPIVYEQQDSADSGLRNQDNDAQSYDASFSQAISWGDEAGNYQISITHTAAQALVG